VGGAAKHNYTTQSIKPQEYKEGSKGLVMSLGFAIFDTCDESKMNLMNRSTMIKWCLHLPFSQSLTAQKSSTSIFWSPASSSTIGPQFLVFSANGPRFIYSQQPSRTNRQQTQLRTTDHSQERLEKSTLNDMACCYGRESVKMTENGATVKEDMTIEVFAA